MIKRVIFILIFLTVIFEKSYSQYRKFDNPIWTIGTANTIPKKSLHLNALYYSQYGITNKIELQTKPLWYYKFPNLILKIEWWYKKSKPGKSFFEKHGIIISSKHGVFYPTPIINYIYKKKLFGLNFNNNTADFIISTKNEMLISFLINSNKGCYTKHKILTFKVGNQKSFFNKSDNLILTKSSLYYRQTVVLGEKSLWYIGFDIDNKFNYGINYSVNLDVYTVGLSMKNMIIEHKGIIYWYWGYRHRIRPALGYQFSYTNQPGIHAGLTPIFDISYLFSVKKGNKNNNLFDNGVIDDADMDNLYD
ncbi:MAG: hypothetical protein JXR68_13755 [Bacteroidales bacterium]|nr:hypothetical protein [Bacteroidales bacterium]